MAILVTGSGGLIGSATCKLFLSKGQNVIGIDNNMRKAFFGKKGDVGSTITSLKEHARYTHHYIDIREKEQMEKVVTNTIDLIVHTAGQPSHDYSALHPEEDFSINALATFQLLELCRKRCPHAVFIFTSTNKVYGDRVNSAALEEQEKRFDFCKDQKIEGITMCGVNEHLSIDQSQHSLFGASKLSADIMVQEYGKYFGMKTGVFRLGCITGPAHAGVSLHGFLAYLISCAKKKAPYIIYGHKGKQVRDQLLADDVALAADAFYQSPRSGEVYNIGGGRENAGSILEIIDILEGMGIRMDISFGPERKADHICYYTDSSKLIRHYPSWKPSHSLREIISLLVGQ